MSWNLDAEITRQRADAANTFNDSCIISRLAETSDGQGGLTQAWTAAGTADCRFVANTGDSKQVGSQFQRVGDYTLTVPVSTDILEQDKITLSSNGAVYRVLFVDDVRDWQTATRVQVNEEISG